MSPYEDIINLPHHVSATRPQMPMSKRAAQFMPFAALTGYDAAIEETARHTDERIILGESVIAALDMKLELLSAMLAERPEITVTFFQPDTRKEGGSYVTVSGELKRIQEIERTFVLTSGTEIPIGDIVEIESDLFRDMF